MRKYIVKKKSSYYYPLTSRKVGKDIHAFIQAQVTWDLVSIQGIFVKLRYDNIEWNFRDDEVVPLHRDINPTDYKQIPFAKEYGISEEGQVLKYGKPPELIHTIKNISKGSTTLTVILRQDDGKKRQVSLASLVLLVYSGENRDRRFIKFLDGDRTNVHKDNLRYVTRKSDCKL